MTNGLNYSEHGSNGTINNHYSPKFTNEPWANSDGLIISLRREVGSKNVVRGRTGPKKWGAEKHLYSQELEDALGRIENRVAPVYCKLLANDPLTPKDRLIWSRWILCQFSRTPSHILELAGLEEDVLASFPAFACDFTPCEIQAKIDAATNGVLDFQDNEQLIPFIVLRDWMVLQPAAGEFFIKGDVPVVIHGALVDDNATIVYPLSPNHCFVATVLSGFPPHQIQAEYRLKPGEASYYMKLVAARAACEVICHPDHCSEELELLVASALGTVSRHLKLGGNHAN
ncbi:MAG: DUF4238 domain-containing protein [Candidatus Nitrotoga sp.]|nr:DUF4238 domain-containing protein [Candidatus Nitrotoga sp.]MDP1855662.1 DUF4238 domain-containing protein [Candidatus Nitrotoga sp.]